MEKLLARFSPEQQANFIAKYVTENQPPSGGTNPHASSGGGKTYQKPCYHYQKHGYCKYGENCYFSHNDHTEIANLEAQLTKLKKKRGGGGGGGGGGGAGGASGRGSKSLATMTSEELLLALGNERARDIAIQLVHMEGQKIKATYKKVKDENKKLKAENNKLKGRSQSRPRRKKKTTDMTSQMARLTVARNAGSDVDSSGDDVDDSDDGDDQYMAQEATAPNSVASSAMLPQEKDEKNKKEEKDEQ